MFPKENIVIFDINVIFVILFYLMQKFNKMQHEENMKVNGVFIRRKLEYLEAYIQAIKSLIMFYLFIYFNLVHFNIF